MHKAPTRIQKAVIVGGFDAAHIGGSFARAATQLDLTVKKFDIADAAKGNRFVRALLWRLADRRPMRIGWFSKEIVRFCASNKPDILIATGSVPVTEQALLELRKLNVFCVNYATDDPWNPQSRSRWFLRALPNYHIVFTPRRANLDDLRKLGCHDVRYLPFGYDEMLHAPVTGPIEGPSCEVLFVGGADSDRVQFVKAFVYDGLSLSLVGSYWERFGPTRRYALGCHPPEAIRRLTAAAKINLCLVRRANRDGHVMRSFEMAAIGACMLVEDTAEHREIFGSDGEAVVYFNTPREAANRAHDLLANPAERARLAATARARVTGNVNSYRDRFSTIMAAAAENPRRFIR